MFLSGYTLGFFFPRRTKHPAAGRADAEAAKTPATKPDRDVDPPLPGSSEPRDVPAALYFYRWF